MRHKNAPVSPLLAAVAAVSILVSISNAALTPITTFNSGTAPFAGLVEGADGNLYGATAGGGAMSNGTVFRVTLEGAPTVLHSFTGGNGGSQPFTTLVRGRDDAFYGTTFAGGNTTWGTLYRITADGTFNVIHAMSVGQEGGSPLASLIQGKDGRFYGTATTGGTANHGTVFRASTNGNLTVPHSFNGFTGGAFPYGALLQTDDSTLFGTTTMGGAGTNFLNSFGTVFRLTTNGAFTVLKAFDGNNGAYPHAGLTRGRDGNFYGVTRGVGPLGNTASLGTIFRISPTGAFTNLYTFTGGGDGRHPYGKLLAASDGALYGTTTGGTNVGGTLFKITTAGAFSALATFNGANGSNPYGDLLQARDGNIYGTTTRGGVDGGGTVFRYDIAAPPFIITQPEGDGVTNRNSATFSVVAGGTQPLTYRWLFKGANLADSDTVLGSHTSTLTLLDVASTNAGAYAVLITNPQGQVLSSNGVLQVITVEPEVTITAPKNNAKVSNDVVTVTGRADGRLGVSTVYFRVNDGGWGPAESSDGWANWSAQAPLVAGTNVIQAQAVDSEGRLSKVETVRVFYTVSTPLTVSINGSGSVKPDYNGAALAVGQGYSMTAKPAKGFAFTGWTGNWTGGVTTNKTKLTFVMQPGLSFTANFVDVSRPVLKVKSPKRKMVVATDTVAMAGTTKENAGVEGVYFRVNGGDWTVAETTNGFASWSGTAGLTTGTNFINTFAADVNGLYSVTNTAMVIYEVE